MFISKTEYKYLLGRVDRLERIVQTLERETYEVVWENNDPSIAVCHARYFGESISITSSSHLYSVKTILGILLGTLGYKLFTVSSKENLILEKKT